jgi:predicted nucleic acid-binding protein
MDLVIAATALELAIPLITGNVKDFKHIPNLEVRSEI